MISDGVKVNTIVTSPPYWGLRSYLPADHPDKAREIGSEPTLIEFIATMTEVMMLAREVLADDGTMWMNMGDCYATGAGKVNTAPGGGTQGERLSGIRGNDKFPGIGPMTQANRMPQDGLKPKDLVGQPWRLAFALQDAGWWLRSDIIWSKPNPMPESCKDRPTKSHEYLFLLAKSERYYFDFDAFQEPVVGGSHARRSAKDVAGWDTGPGRHDTVQYNTPKASKTGVGFGHGTDASNRGRNRVKNNKSMDAALLEVRGTRNRRTVWTINTQGYHGAHFATFPEELIEPCILAGCPAGGTVLDIFFGSGTTGQVAQALGRKFIGIDINEANRPLQAERLRQPSFEFAEAA
nr:site-specific DNA-methyltransferase [uncultured Rhodoferax sp.]